MRVLHVIASVSPRLGGPSNVLGLARALVRNGCETSVYTTDLDEQGTWLPWRAPRRLSVPLDRPVPEGGADVRYFRAGWPSRFGCSWPLAAALRRDVPAFDLVHIHSLYLFHGLVAGLVCRRAGVPYLIRPHGTLDPLQRRHHRGRKVLYTALIERHNLNGAAAMHYTSDAEARNARAAGVRTPGIVVGMGVDLAEYSVLPEPGRFRASFPALRDKRLVLFLGRIAPKKGFDLLVPAFAALSRSRPDLHLVIAGPAEGPYTATVEGLIARHGIADRVTWLGLVTGRAKLELLRDADVFVLPSYEENFAIAVVEAMAAGLPVVITDRVGIHEAVRRAGAGTVVTPDAAAVAAALEALLSAPARGQQMGRDGRRLALEAFSWDAAAGSLIREYDALVDARRAARRTFQPAGHV